MIKVSRRGGFSDRQGIKSENMEIQLKDLDIRTRTQIYNLINAEFEFLYNGAGIYNSNIQGFCRYVKAEVFCQQIHAGNIIDVNIVFIEINEVIMNQSYDDVLTLLEAIAVYWNNKFQEIYDYYKYELDPQYINIFEKCNQLFEREYVGYRFIGGLISPISNEIEMDTIQESLDSEYSAVTSHITKAHSLLANREHPDYENSIKESISSVEAMCGIVTGVRGKEATLGNMLKKLEQRGVVIHSALKSAFNILYGYTSDANGIRHAGDIGGKASTFEEAKFMLISCCAFINYLKGIMAD